MHLHALDIAIIVGYFVLVLCLGLWVSRKGTKDLDSYFLGGKSLPWYVLGVSDASGMFDIAGTMWLVMSDASGMFDIAGTMWLVYALF
ncbi:MAG TPA: hypothetical protein PKN08_08035, partial [Opitutaceae bacterium]|nr:hypothetical protein [Opitutaceae bacterium]